MKFFGLMALLAGLLTLAPGAHADARQYVVVVADGVSPQLLTLGQDYLRKADESPDLDSAFTTLANAKDAKPDPDGFNVLGEIKGLLETAHAAGFKTGLVTTGDLTTEAPFWYNVTGDALGSADAHYDVLAGGGRAKLGAAGDAVSEAGGTYIGDTDGLVREIKGRILAAQADEEMSYELDRNPEKEGGLGELAEMAMSALGDDDTPFVLVIHDTLIQKALLDRDTPAIFEEFRSINSILSNALDSRETNPNLSITALLPATRLKPTFALGTDVSNAYSTIASLGRSYYGAGLFLQGADADTFAAFIDPESGEYRDWKPSDADKARILAKKLDGEAAVRAFYEPLLRIQYTPEAASNRAVSVGLDMKNGLAAGLRAAVSTPVKRDEKTN